MRNFYFFSAFVRRPVRLLLLIGLIGVGLLILGLAFPFLPQHQREKTIMAWTGVLLKTLGIRVHRTGSAPSGAALLVANHISWADPFLLMAHHAMCFVAKAEIRDWPVLGWLAAQAGTVFIRRDRLRDLVNVSQTFIAHLEGGTAVGVFPESTTSDGKVLLPFKTALFQVAINARTDCYPVAIHYDRPEAIWIEDMGLLSSVWRLMALKQTTAHIHYCPVIPSRGHNRHTLAQASATAIANALCLPAGRNLFETPSDLPVLTH